MFQSKVVKYFSIVLGTLLLGVTIIKIFMEVTDGSLINVNVVLNIIFQLVLDLFVFAQVITRMNQKTIEEKYNARRIYSNWLTKSSGIILDIAYIGGYLLCLAFSNVLLDKGVNGMLWFIVLNNLSISNNIKDIYVGETGIFLMQKNSFMRYDTMLSIRLVNTKDANIIAIEGSYPIRCNKQTFDAIKQGIDKQGVLNSEPFIDIV